MAVQDQPVLVTTVGQSPQAERRDRERRYLITMAVRVVAIIVAIAFTRGWIRTIAVILSVTLPWVAVVLANSGPRRQVAQQPSLYSRRGPRAIDVTDPADTAEPVDHQLR